MADENGGNWRDELTDELRDAPALKDIPDLQTLAKNHVDLQQHLGNTRRVPKPDEAQEDIDSYFDKILNQDEVTKGKIMVKPDLTKEDQADTFYRSLGKPENSDGYTLPEFGEDITVNDEFVKGAMATAHSLNLTDAQFQQYLKGAVEQSLTGQKRANEAHNDDIKGLREEWGHAFDQNINEAVGFAKKTNAPEAMVEALTEGNADSRLLKWLQGLSRQTGSEIPEVGGQEGGARTETPAELRARRTSLMRKMDELDRVGTPQAKAEARDIYKEVLDIGEKLQPVQ